MLHLLALLGQLSALFVFEAGLQSCGYLFVQVLCDLCMVLHIFLFHLDYLFSQLLTKLNLLLPHKARLEILNFGLQLGNLIFIKGFSRVVLELELDLHYLFLLASFFLHVVL